MNNQPMAGASHSPAVSVIVPVYKAEAYLHRCVDSLLAQTMPDFEILLIDDGSPDRSGGICDAYAAKDTRVLVFHKPNEGVSATRQFGLDHARGEYVIHADPDDWVEPDMLEHMLGEIRKTGADMLICDFWRHGGSLEPVYFSQHPRSFDRDRLLKGFIRGCLHGATWNKLVRLSFIRSHRIAFDPQTSFWEDLYFTCELVRTGARVTYLPHAYYHYDYCTSDNSIVRVGKVDNLYSMKRFVDYFNEVLDEHTFREELLFLKAGVRAWACGFGIDDGKGWYPELDQFLTSIWSNLFSPLFVIQLRLILASRPKREMLIRKLRQFDKY